MMAMLMCVPLVFQKYNTMFHFIKCNVLANLKIMSNILAITMHLVQEKLYETK